jgi:hypothetical protein
MTIGCGDAALIPNEKEFVIPAQAGIHFSTDSGAAWWVPAFAATTARR